MVLGPAAGHEGDQSCSKESARGLYQAIGKVAVAARDIVLGEFEESDRRDQQHEDGQAVFRVTQTERGPKQRIGSKPLHAGRSSGDGANLDRAEGKDRDGEDEKPRDPAKKGLWCHVACLADCTAIVHCSSDTHQPRPREG
jgi:hypothetical protein